MNARNISMTALGALALCTVALGAETAPEAGYIVEAHGGASALGKPGMSAAIL